MNPVEQLQAAIDKLETLKAERAPSPWIIRNGFINVTLHRTIDAQLSILNSARADAEYGREPSPSAMWLADAILGGDA